MSGLIKGVFVGIIVIYIAIMFIVQMTPTMESDISSANITNPMTSSLVDMSEWIIPVLAIVGVIIAGFAAFKLRGGRGSAEVGLMAGPFLWIAGLILIGVLAYRTGLKPFSRWLSKALKKKPETV